MKNLILAMGIMFVAVSSGMYTNIAQAEYPQSTTTPLAVDLDFNGKKISNIGDVVTKGPWVDVRAYGAVGDGVADDTTAIQNAINAISTAGTVYVPTGTYKISSALSFGTKAIQFLGTGIEATKIVLANSSNSDMILVGAGVSMTYGGRIAYMTLDGNKANQTGGHGIRLRNIVDFTVEQVHVTGAKTDGIYIDGEGGVANGRNKVLSSLVDYNGRQGIYVGFRADGTYIQGCWVGDNGTIGDDSANVTGDSAASLFIVGNCFWQSTGPNLRFHAFQQALVCGNYILSATKENIRFTGTATRDSAIITISGNTFSAASTAGANLYPHIQLGTGAGSSASSVVISSNTFSVGNGPTQSAIVDEVSQSTNNLVALNNINGSVTTINIRGTGSRKVQNTPEGTNQLSNIQVPSGDIIMTGPNQAIYTNVANSDLTVRSNGTGKLFLNPSSSGRVDIGNNSYGVTIGGGTGVILQHLAATATWDPPSLNNGTVTSTTVTVTGAGLGDIVNASHNQIGANNVILSAHVEAANTVRVVLRNDSGGTLNITSGTLRVTVWKY